ncbi:hypothetical protein Taro_052232, partial [Colocasia esculenta]|nr:hypothetical protein [Colocasia esculenta]
MVCNFWRWSKIWKAPFSRQKASSGSVWALPFRWGPISGIYIPPHVQLYPRSAWAHDPRPIPLIPRRPRVQMDLKMKNQSELCRHTVPVWQMGLLETGSSVDTAWDCSMANIEYQEIDESTR